MPYRTLNHDKIIETAVALEQRIEERFPQTGLRQVAAELVSLSRDTSAEARKLEGPIWPLRLILGGLRRRCCRFAISPPNLGDIIFKLQCTHIRPNRILGVVDPNKGLFTAAAIDRANDGSF